FERRAAHDQRDLAGELRQVETGLPRRVGTPDHAYHFPCESGALGPGGAVEQSRPGPPIERWHAESPVLDPGRENDRTPEHVIPTGQCDRVQTIARGESDRAVSEHELGAEQ